MSETQQGRSMTGYHLAPLFLDIWRDCDGPAETLLINVGLRFGYRSLSLGLQVAW